MQIEKYQKLVLNNREKACMQRAIKYFTTKLQLFNSYEDETNVVEIQEHIKTLNATISILKKYDKVMSTKTLQEFIIAFKQYLDIIYSDLDAKDLLYDLLVLQ